jgi:REP element-mobilizing transposase RayT
MAHRFTSLFMHVIFSTKERSPFLDDELAPQCRAYLGGIVENIGCRRIEIGGVVDHVHLLVDMSSTIALSDFIRTIKSNSSKWVHETWMRRSDFHWQQGFAAFSVSRSAVDRVVKYIRGQEVHHRHVSYQDEVRELLRRHGFECDERYMWE